VGASRSLQALNFVSDEAPRCLARHYDYYGDFPYPCTNCSNKTVSTYRALRGGSMSDHSGYLRTFHRNGFPPDYPHPRVGLRCARPAG
jgi:formylglycine-generating enzyme required for sulfatase activity